MVLAAAGRRIVVVAASEPSAALAEALSATGARVTVLSAAAEEPAVAPDPACASRIELVSRAYVRGDLAGAFAVVCLETGETAVAVAAEAEAVGCLVHVAGRPELSTFRFAEGFLPPNTEE